MSGLQLHAWFISSNTCSLFPHSLSLSLSRVATTPFYLFFHNPFSFASLILCFLSLSFCFLCYSDSFFSFISPSIYSSILSFQFHCIQLIQLWEGEVFLRRVVVILVKWVLVLQPWQLQSQKRLAIHQWTRFKALSTVSTQILHGVRSFLIFSSILILQLMIGSFFEWYLTFWM